MTWIDRHDRLPDAQTGALVLAWHDQGGMKIETAYRVGKLSHYTHWAELPVAPGMGAGMPEMLRAQDAGAARDGAQGAAVRQAAGSGAASGYAAYSGETMKRAAGSSAAGSRAAWSGTAGGCAAGSDAAMNRVAESCMAGSSAAESGDAVNRAAENSAAQRGAMGNGAESYAAQCADTGSQRHTPLYAAREAAMLSMARLARAAGIKATEYMRYENGDCEPLVRDAIKIADVLHTFDLRKLFPYTPSGKKPEPARHPIKARKANVAGRDARLYNARKAAGLYQSELARCADVDLKAYSRIEVQDSDPTISVALRIADALGITDIREIF